MIVKQRELVASLSDVEMSDFVMFINTMADKLIANKHKSGWVFDSVESLRARINDELAELDMCVTKDDDQLETVQEAADVANFLMMLSGNYCRGRLARKLDKERGA